MLLVNRKIANNIFFLLKADCNNLNQGNCIQKLNSLPSAKLIR